MNRNEKGGNVAEAWRNKKRKEKENRAEEEEKEVNSKEMFNEKEKCGRK